MLMSNDKLIVRITASGMDLFERLSEIEENGTYSWLSPKGFRSKPAEASADKCERCKEEMKKGGRYGPKDTEYEGKLICGQCELELLQEKRNEELRVARGEVDEPEKEEEDDGSKIVIRPYWGGTIIS
jgi:hypothetical protein